MPTTTSTPLDLLRAHRDSLYTQGFVLGEFGKSIPTFPTGITRSRGEQLCGLLQREGVRNTIETGFALGLSSLYIIEAALQSSALDQINHTAVDPFQRSDWNNAGVRTVREAGVAHRVRLLQEDSALVLPALAASTAEEKFDAAFVDGSHLFDGVFVDVFYMTRLVRPGGMIILDDYWMPAVRAAIDFFVTNLGMPLELIPDEKNRPRLAVLRVKAETTKRAWDHFAPFNGAA